MGVNDFILFVERFKICKFSKELSLKMLRLLIWFLDALTQIKLGNPTIIEISAMALVFKSRYLIYLYFKMMGNNFSIYFYAIDKRLYAIVRLFAVLPSPESDPFKIYYNFFKSYYAFILASSSAFFLSSSFNLSYYSLAFYYSSNCSLVF